MWIPRGHSKMWDCPGSEVWVPPEHSKSLKKAVLLVVQTVGLTTGTIAFSFSSTTLTEMALGLVVLEIIGLGVLSSRKHFDFCQ